MSESLTCTGTEVFHSIFFFSYFVFLSLSLCLFLIFSSSFFDISQTIH